MSIHRVYSLHAVLLGTENSALFSYLLSKYLSILHFHWSGRLIFVFLTIFGYCFLCSFIKKKINVKTLKQVVRCPLNGVHILALNPNVLLECVSSLTATHLYLAFIATCTFVWYRSCEVWWAVLVTQCCILCRESRLSWLVNLVSELLADSRSRQVSRWSAWRYWSERLWL